MARRASPTTVDPEDDTFHPRRTLELVGHREAITLAARAIRSGMPPQAWLIGGPPGIGKATLAYRIARYLLAYGATDTGADDLSVPPGDAATKLVAAGAHPGLKVLARKVDPQTGKPKSVLEVDEVRTLSGFFGMTAGMGGWRIALIDAVDDMNDFAANAVLKILEEPPARSLLLLVSHAPGKVLPTIRSRCRRLSLRPLPDPDMRAVLTTLMPDLEPNERDGLIRLAGGSPGAALRLGAGDGMMLAAEADRLLDAAAPDIPALFALAEKLARMADGLGLFGDCLTQALSARIRAQACEGRPHLQAWIAALERIERDAAAARILHLDPRQTVLQAACATAAGHAGAW